MPSRSALRWFLVPLLSAVVACGSSPSSVTAITAPLTTQTFTGTLNQNGAMTFPFTTVAAGTVTATLKSVDPDATVAFGIALGNWDGSACAWVVANDNALVGAVVSGSAAGPSSLCVRVYDTGHLSSTSLNFSIDVAHP